MPIVIDEMTASVPGAPAQPGAPRAAAAPAAGRDPTAMRTFEAQLRHVQSRERRLRAT